MSGSNSINQQGIYGTQGVLSPSNAPGARILSVLWIDVNGTLWLFGGRNDLSGNYKTDIFIKVS